VIYFSDFEAGGAANPYGLVGSGATDEALGGGSQSLAIPYPSGVLAGDIAFIHIMVIQVSSPVTLTLPSGWNEAAHERFNGAYHHYLLWRRLDGSESGSVTVAISAGGSSSSRFGVMSAWGGCVATGDPFESLVNNEGASNSANCVSAAVTTTVDNEYILNFVGRSETATSFTPPSGYTEAYDVNNTVGGDGSLTQNYKIAATAGVQGASTTVAGTSGRWGVISLALIEA